MHYLWPITLLPALLFCSLPSTPPATPPKPTPQGSPFVDVSFLIWQSKMWGVEFSAKSTQPTEEETLHAALKENISVPDFAWRPGAKLEVGYQFAADKWDLDARWTWYRGETTRLKKHFEEQIAPEGMGIIPLWFYPFYTVHEPSVIRFSSSTSSWRHYFDSIDLEMGRLSTFGRLSDWHFFTGLKGAWIHQYYRVEYANGSTVDALIAGGEHVVYSLLQSTVSFDNRTWGGGPRLGFDSRWKFGWGLALEINTAFSLLYSALKTTRDQEDLNVQVDTASQVPYHLTQHTNSHGLEPVLEAQFGIDWKYDFFTTSEVGLAVLYEFQYWWGQNLLRRGYSHLLPGGTFPSRGDLQMHGLTATASYRY
ncbi:MAG: hypothetical protein KGI80_00745 [Verrucomicrobiota bacterium]|nr:hypothetical protein [Verrucomicrobiota bacterium]